MNQQLNNNQLYKTLGIDKTATADEIKKAYRQKAKETHPDKNNGNDEEFKKVNEAYATLSDPMRKERYDRSGDTSNYSFEQKFAAYVSGNTIPFLEISIKSGTTILEIFKTACKEEISTFKRQIMHDSYDILNLEKYLKKVKAKNGINYIEETLKKSIEVKRTNIAAMKSNIEFFTQVKKRLEDDYEYEQEQKNLITKTASRRSQYNYQHLSFMDNIFGVDSYNL